MKDKGTSVKLGGKVRTLKFDLNSLCVLGEKFENIDDAFNGLEKRDFKIIRTLIYCVLASDEDEDFTEKDAGSLVTLANITDVVDALSEALSEAMPEPTDEGKK